MSMSLTRQNPKGVNTGYPAGGPMQTMPGQQPYPQQPMGQPMGQPMPGQQPYPQQPMGQPMPGQQPYPQQPMGQPMGQPMPGQQPYPQQPMGQPMGQPMPGQQPYPQQPMGQPMPGQQPYPQQPMGQPMGQMPMGQVGMNPPIGAGGRVSLVKGQNMNLTKAAPSLQRAVVGLGWDVRQTAGAAFDLDTSCFLLNGQNMIGKPQDFIFYNNKQSVDGSVMHMGDNLTGQGEGDDEQIVVDLSRVPMDIQRIEFVCSIYEAEMRGQNFGQVSRAFIRICDQTTRQEIVRFDLTEEASMWSCMMFGELYRYGNEWKFKALGNGIQGGLRAAGAQYGMQLA